MGRGREKPLPAGLVRQYIEERRRHYRMLHHLIVEEGHEPLEALYRALEEAWREAEQGAEWADLDWLQGLGST